MHSVVLLLEDSKIVFQTQHLPLSWAASRARSQAEQRQRREYRESGRNLAEIAWVGCERRAFSARDARGSSQVSFDLYLVRTVFLYFSWNGTHPHGAKSI